MAFKQQKLQNCIRKTATRILCRRARITGHTVEENTDSSRDATESIKKKNDRRKKEWYDNKCRELN